MTTRKPGGQPGNTNKRGKTGARKANAKQHCNVRLTPDTMQYVLSVNPSLSIGIETIAREHKEQSTMSIRSTFINKTTMKKVNAALVTAGYSEYPGDDTGAGRNGSGYAINLIDYIAGQDHDAAHKIEAIVMKATNQHGRNEL